jgi:hypothetical protein
MLGETDPDHHYAPLIIGYLQGWRKTRQLVLEYTDQCYFALRKILDLKLAKGGRLKIPI